MTFIKTIEARRTRALGCSRSYIVKIVRNLARILLWFFSGPEILSKQGITRQGLFKKGAKTNRQIGE